MHLAAAVGTPYVALFGPTPAEERAPLEGRGAVVVKSLPCAPCDSPFCRNKIFQECIVRIELGEIMHAVEKVVWDYVLTGGTTRLEAGARGDSA
jgi:ADP-heptose:LPS heptosyltransferase